MGVDDSSGAAANAMLQPKGPCPGTSSASKGSRSSSGSLDICGSISEYLLQLHAAAPSLHPVPCASFFTAQTTVKDLADCSASGGISSSSMARDLLASVSQHQAEGNAKAFKAFARSFHAAATQRLAGAKVCSVCAAVRQQKQQQEEQEGYGQWGLCLLPHLDPSQQVKSFSLPQVGRVAAVIAPTDVAGGLPLVDRLRFAPVWLQTLSLLFYNCFSCLSCCCFRSPVAGVSGCFGSPNC